MPTVRERTAPALIGRKEAARLLGIKPENLYRIEGVPRPLQDRGIKGFEVTTGPLWPRVEIEELVKLTKAAKAKRDRELATRRKTAEARRRPRARAASAR
jgi:hypothetical protein